MKMISTLNVRTCALSLVLGLMSHAAVGCTIFEFMESRIPLNSVEIPNVDRVKIAEMVIKARTWPDTEIRGVVQPAAYIHERNPTVLVKERGDNLKAYLLQLGVKEENFWIEPRIVKESEARDAHGNLDIHQLGVTLFPICEGGCGRLCNDPRVTPVTKAVK